MGAPRSGMAAKLLLQLSNCFFDLMNPNIKLNNADLRLRHHHHQ